MFNGTPKRTLDAIIEINKSKLEDLAEKRIQILKKIENIGNEVKVLQGNHDQGVSIDKFRVDFLQNELVSLREELFVLEKVIKIEVEEGIKSKNIQE